MNLSGRFAIVTGGARGIGFAIAERLVHSGAACCLWDRDEAALAGATTRLSERGVAHGVRVDVTQADAVQAALQTTLGHTGGIDILVNNAGIAGATRPTWELTPAEWQEVLQVDLFSVYLCCHAVVPHMIERGRGRIVNIASIAGKEGNPNASHYSAAKAGVIGLTKSLGKELARHGILVNAVAPAVIETDILQQMTQAHVDYMLSKIPLARFGRLDEIAALVAWLSSDECSFNTGAVFDLSGGRATY